MQKKHAEKLIKLYKSGFIIYYFEETDDYSGWVTVDDIDEEKLYMVFDTVNFYIDLLDNDINIDNFKVYNKIQQDWTTVKIDAEEREEKIKVINELYHKERQYQIDAFGNYEEIKSLNVASFLILIKHYLEKAQTSYSGPWSKELPLWMTQCQEFDYENSAPIKTYEELIKIFALTGAALETYIKVNLSEWRNNTKENLKKWKKGEIE